MLGLLLLQDIERHKRDGNGYGGVRLRDGVSKGRVISVHDPEMLHGHKSSSKRFDGHKAAIVVDPDTQLITAEEVLPGNAADNLGTLELVEESEANTGVPVEEAMGEAAYGDGGTRQAFADACGKLVARVSGRPDRQRFPKDDFVIGMEQGTCTCPAGQVTRNSTSAGSPSGASTVSSRVPVRALSSMAKLYVPDVNAGTSLQGPVVYSATSDGVDRYEA